MNKASVILRDSVRQTDKYYTYLVPDRLKDVITYGSYVEVPFGRGNRDKQALVTDINEVGDGEDTSKLKEIRRLIDPIPVMTEEQIALIKPLSSRYLCTMGDVVSLSLRHYSYVLTTRMRQKECSQKENSDLMLRSIF